MGRTFSASNPFVYREYSATSLKPTSVLHLRCLTFNVLSNTTLDDFFSISVDMQFSAQRIVKYENTDLSVGTVK